MKNKSLLNVLAMLVEANFMALKHKAVLYCHALRAGLIKARANFHIVIKNARANTTIM